MQFRHWLMETDKDDFLAHHRTGFINSAAYERSTAPGAMKWLEKNKYPILLSKKNYGQYEVEFRLSGEKLQYVQHDANDEIARKPNGELIYMTPEEIKAEGLPETDESIVAFIGDQGIAHASNEWGTMGVWVEKPYQRLGIGTDLMMMFMEKSRHFLTGHSKIGQMTAAGENAVLKTYDKLEKKYGKDWFANREKLN